MGNQSNTNPLLKILTALKEEGIKEEESKVNLEEVASSIQERNEPNKNNKKTTD